ncbi:MAG: HYR domain-containing protein, partial [Flavobacteriales bacterium]|nr:HYR domain-containing protein [Flavobacteriales bacterium]
AFENAASVWGGPQVQAANTFVTQSFQQVSSSQTNTFDLCEVSVGVDMAYIVLDCHTGNMITSGTWTSDGACQTITVTPPSTNIDATSTWSGTTGLTTITDWGVAIFDPGAVGAGSYTVNYVWDDGSGCTGTGSHVVTVTDPTPPTVVCPGNISVSNDVGSCNASVVTPNPATADNCAVQDLTWALTGATVGTSAATGINNVGTATFNVGITTVTYTVGDGSNTVTCSFTVTVTDTENPTITCPINQAAVVDASCNFTVPDYSGMTAFADNCPGVVLTQAPVAGTVVSIGTTNIVMTATDASLNTANCNFNLVVTDNIDPVAVCQNISINLDGTGNATTTAAAVDFGSSDNCSIASLVLSQTAFTCADIGANAVTLTVTDGSGNTDVCAATVTIVDNTDPTAVCQNVTIFLDGTGNASITAVAVDNGSSDNCSVASLALDITAFTCANIGANAVTLTVTDVAGNTATCGAIITVVDNTNPTITCPGNQNPVFDASCQCTLPDYTGLATSADNCSEVVTQSPLAGTVITGTTTITLTSTDPSSNSAFCTFDVIPSDGVNPVAVCQNITIFLDGTGNATATAAAVDNGSTDNCGITGMSLDVTAFTCLDLGANPVVLTVVDGSANSDNCGATVTVVDNTDPIAVCQNVTIFLDGTGNATTTAVAVDNGSSDNCSVASLALDITTFTCANIGANAVTLTVTDGSGNFATCGAIVTVVDNTNPTITCPGNQNVAFDAACQYTLLDYTAMATSADNCSEVVTQSPIAGTVITATTTITLTSTDPSSNSAFCTFDVIPADGINPVAICQNITINVDGTGNATATAAAVDFGSTDNCAVTGMSLDITAFTCLDLGANPVVLTVVDASGNSDNCAATVTVVDNIDPTAVCQSITIFLDATGNATATAAAVDFGSTDNCSVASLALDITAFTCADIGANAVTLTVTDGSGNTATCAATVTVVDNINPTAVCQNISVALDATGNATITAGAIDNGSSDNCSIASMTLDITGFTCADIGANTVTLTVLDGSGNSDNCTATVTITDPNVPTATAGADATICDYDTYVLAGTLGGSAATGTWTSSLDGTFSLVTDPNATYIPGPLAIAAGSVVLTWTTDPSPCVTANGTMTLTINPAP